MRKYLKKISILSLFLYTMINLYGLYIHLIAMGSPNDFPMISNSSLNWVKGLRKGP